MYSWLIWIRSQPKVQRELLPEKELLDIFSVWCGVLYPSAPTISIYQVDAADVFLKRCRIIITHFYREQTLWFWVLWDAFQQVGTGMMVKSRRNKFCYLYPSVLDAWCLLYELCVEVWGEGIKECGIKCPQAKWNCGICRWLLSAYRQSFAVLSCWCSTVHCHSFTQRQPLTTRFVGYV